MKKYVCIICVVLLTYSGIVAGQENEKEVALKNSIKGFSKSTTISGKGWETYGSFLHKDFTKWFVGRPIVHKQTLVTTIKDWWEDGYRISKEKSDIISLDIIKNIGFVRIDRFEESIDKSGKNIGNFHGYVTQLWIFEDEKWQLLSINISVAQ